MTVPHPTPADAFHPSEFIQAEMDARGWDRWTLAHRMGGDVARNRLVIDLYFEVGPDKTNMQLGEPTARQFGEALGVNPQFFLNLETVWRASRARH